MKNDIIQHHEPFDLRAFYEKVKSSSVRVEYEDFDYFMHLEGEKHSFIGESNLWDRVGDAMHEALDSDDALSILNRANALLMTIVRPLDSLYPLRLEELKPMSEFFSSLPDGCEVSWGIADDRNPDDAVRVIILVNSK